MEAEMRVAEGRKMTVITVCYNSKDIIRKTIESVLRQTYSRIEYIIVDGGSKDGTVETAQSYRKQFQKKGYAYRIISEPDRGIYDAMNKGVAMATGDVVGILNSDDFYSSSDILMHVDREIHDVDAVYGDIHYVNDSDIHKCVRYYSSKSFRRWKMRLGFMPAHPSFYCRRTVYSRFGLFDTDFRVAADFEQLLRLIFINRIFIKYLPLDFVTMRTGGASTSGFQSHKKIIRDHIRAYRKNGIYSNYFLESLRYAYKVCELGCQRLLGR